MDSDLIEKGVELGFFLSTGKDSKRVIAAVENFVDPDALDDASKDSGVVEERTGGAVVVNVFENALQVGVTFEEGKSSAPMRENDF